MHADLDFMAVFLDFSGAAYRIDDENRKHRVSLTYDSLIRAYARGLQDASTAARTMCDRGGDDALNTLADELQAQAAILFNLKPSV